MAERRTGVQLRRSGAQKRQRTGLAFELSPELRNHQGRCLARPNSESLKEQRRLAFPPWYCRHVVRLNRDEKWMSMSVRSQFALLRVCPQLAARFLQMA
jgi:hypothetical protein